MSVVKRSKVIVLRLLPLLSAAALAAGCGSRGRQEQGWQTCVDAAGRVADDQACFDGRRAVHPVGYVPMYRWYYYPFGGRRYPVGYGVPLGGTYSTDPFRNVPTPSIGAAGARSSTGTGNVRFGGFGSTASGTVGQ